MKKIRLWLILFVVSFCFQQETYAQWIDLGMKTSDFQAGQEYYLYNKDANAFFCGIGTRNDGIYYGTRAGVTTSLEAQPIIIQPALAEFVCEGTHDNGVITMDENLSFDVLESLYPEKDSASAYRQSSENDWNALSDEDKRKAIAYIQTSHNDGTAAFNDMFLSQFLKKKPWL